MTPDTKALRALLEKVEIQSDKLLFPNATTPDELNTLVIDVFNTLPALLDRLDALESETQVLREALRELQTAEALYRQRHDMFGGDSIESGRAWDVMRRAGDRARQALGEENSK